MGIQDFILSGDEFVRRMREGGLPLVENHVVVGDSLDLLKYLPEGCVDLVHTSPPYNIDKQYQSGRPDLSSQETYREFLERAIGEIKRTLRSNGSAFWQTGYTQAQDGIPGDLLPIDMLTHQYFKGSPYPTVLWDRIIWRYFGGMAFKKKLTNKHETILWYVKPEGRAAEPCFEVDQIREKSKELDKRNNFWGRNPGNVWEVDRVAFGAIEQSSHIAVFPEEISEKLVRACSQPGNLLLDPFSGSGTLPKVARSLGRRWLAMEISEAYALESVRRLGYQQPSEASSLVSAIIKFEVFGAGKRAMSVDAIAETLTWWLSRIDVTALRTEFDELTRRALADTTRSKSQKRAAWVDLNGRIEKSRSTDPVVIADRYLCRDYKNRRNLNGPMRYGTALEILESLCQQVVASGRETESLVRQIAEDEPSSYLVDGDEITLTATEKRLKETGQTEAGISNEFPEINREPEEAGAQSQLLL